MPNTETNTTDWGALGRSFGLGLAEKGVEGLGAAGGAFVGARFGSVAGFWAGGLIGGPAGAAVGGVSGFISGGVAGAVVGAQSGDTFFDYATGKYTVHRSDKGGPNWSYTGQHTDDNSIDWSYTRNGFDITYKMPKTITSTANACVSTVLVDRVAGRASHLQTCNDPNTIEAGSGDDMMLAMGGDDFLFGQDGNDTMYGGAGRDKLYGGNHNDILQGGSGADTYIGGNGRDKYYFNDGGNKIMDFNNEDHDSIVLAAANQVVTKATAIVRDGKEYLASFTDKLGNVTTLDGDAQPYTNHWTLAGVDGWAEVMAWV